MMLPIVARPSGRCGLGHAPAPALVGTASAVHAREASVASPVRTFRLSH